MQRRRWGVVVVLCCLALLMQVTQVTAQQSLQLRVNRWLEVRQLTGQVSVTIAGASRSAQVGDRLQAVGDSLSTGQNASARLAVDTEVGFVNVTENTTLQIQSLQVAPDNGRITRLQVTRGRVQVQVRPFTQRGSRLEIETPAGISGVRGTEFGLLVQPDGKTGLATRQGRVVSSAQGRSVAVNAGFQNFTIPGEAPTPAVPLQDDPYLNYRFVQVIEAGVRYVRLVGQVDPVNQVVVEDIQQTTDRNGQFSVLLPLPSYPRYRVTVTTPLGTRQDYELAVS